MANGASEVVAICNEQMMDVQARLQEIQNGGQVPLKFIVKSTPSSMHSMWELSRWLGDEPFVLTTVDTIFRESEFETYIKTFHSLIARGEADGLMGVTDYIDDEKPLYVSTDESLRITGFLDSCDAPKYIAVSSVVRVVCGTSSVPLCATVCASRRFPFRRYSISIMPLT